VLNRFGGTCLCGSGNLAMPILPVRMGLRPMKGDKSLAHADYQSAARCHLAPQVAIQPGRGFRPCSRLSGGFYTPSASLRTQDLPTQVAIGRILAAIPAESSVARRRKPPERRLQPGLAAPRTAGATTPPNRLSNRSGFGGGMLPAGVAGQLCHRRLSNGRATLAFYWTS
jgi:hypothetical protein